VSANKKKILINTGGGDAPGLNGVIRSATLAALERGWEVWGIKHGYRGMFESDGLLRLDRDAVRGIAHLGGTVLGTANRGDPFYFPTHVTGQSKAIPTDRADELVERFKSGGFDALIAIGGDGSMTIANKLMERGLPMIVGVPKTIDNDVAGTDVTFGYDTAVSIATEALDRLHTTTESHERVMVVEVMGRHAGWIAIASGLAGGADAILIPEIDFRSERVAQKILQRERRGRRFSIIVVAEGANPLGGDVAVKAEGDEFRRAPVLGGIAERLASELGRLTGKETRSIVLGHLLRGGHPSSADRLLALRFGVAAVSEIAGGDQSGMVAMKGGEVRLVPIEEAAGKTRTVPTDRGILLSARELGICFGDEPESSFATS